MTVLHLRLHKQIMWSLIGQIARGAFAEHDLLPSEGELATQFDASRGVVREALRGLEERGLVTVRHGHGTVVSASSRWDLLDADVLAATLATPGSAKILAELLECRRLLEIEAAGLAAERSTAADITALSDALSRMTTMAARGEWDSVAESMFHEADVAFHNAIFRATENRILARVAESIQRALFTARLPLARPEARLERATPEHKAILTAIATHDAVSAREAMRAHLDTIAGYLVDYTTNLTKAESQ